MGRGTINSAAANMLLLVTLTMVQLERQRVFRIRFCFEVLVERKFSQVQADLSLQIIQALTLMVMTLKTRPGSGQG